VELLLPQQTISNHLEKMPGLANLLNTDLSRGFTVAQVAECHPNEEGHPCEEDTEDK